MTQPAERSTSLTFFNHHWDPTGTKLLYVEHYGDGPAVYVRDLLEGTDTLVWQVPDTVQGWVHCRWSPKGDKIVLNSLGAIWTVNPDGTGLFKLLDKERGSQWYPFFSPDGEWIVYSGVIYTGNRWDSRIGRVPAAGGEPVYLTRDMDKLVPKYSEGWFAE